METVNDPFQKEGFCVFGSLADPNDRSLRYRQRIHQSNRWARRDIQQSAAMTGQIAAIT
ncbi:MAG: hypothetical protein WKF84_09370 [Pyrinomonadaceae bacterium]